MARTPDSRGAGLTVFESELGWMGMAWIDGQVSRLTFGHPSPQAAAASLQLDCDPSKATGLIGKLTKRLQAFAADDRKDDFLDVPLFMSDKTPFQQAVIERCRRIPRGETLSYGELAAAVGHPGAARAVGTVMSSNRFPLIVPCHRVVGARGAIGGYTAPDGVAMKRRLLAMEEAAAPE